MTKIQKNVTVVGVIILMVVVGIQIFRQDTRKKQSPESKDYSGYILALNTDKTNYLPGEKMTVSMASVNDKGYTVCDSNLKLELINSQGITETANITKSSSCGNDSITNDSDYLALLPLTNQGRYRLKLTNLDTNKSTEIEIEVVENIALDIQRSSATRINPTPGNRYPMIITIKANQDFQGQIKEQIPTNFQVVWQGDAKVEGTNIIWDVNLKNGEVKSFSYEYSVPETSKKLEKFGPIFIDDQNLQNLWQAISAK